MEETRHFSFFQNRKCEYFPCHSDVPEDEFNCLFCYCPLYALGKSCKGNYMYTEQHFKDCSKCTIPHQRNNYERILERYNDIMRVVQLMDEHK